jgi:predicted transcriptional regulator
MLSRFSSLATRRMMTSTTRMMSATVADVSTADDALELSGYKEINFKIDEDAMVYDAVQRFAANNIGCLVTTDKAGTLNESELV